MIELKRGDYIRQTTEGKVSEVYDDEVIFYTTKGQRRYAILDEVVKIDPPVQVHDEINYEQAQRLPNRSVVLGLNNKRPYEVIGSILFYGLSRIREEQARQPFRVLVVGDGI